LENVGTGKQKSLRTRDKKEALRVLNAQHEAQENPSINVQIARAYLHVADPAYNTRTWTNVFGHIVSTFAPDSESARRWLIAEKDKAYDFIRNKLVAETRAEDFLNALNAGTVSTNLYLRRLQNYALGMSWLIVPVVPKKLFPPVKYGLKRAITPFEHERVLAREANPERHAYYELLWHTGGSQGDIARLHAEDVDKANQVISFQRAKTRWRDLQPACLKYGHSLELVLARLPQVGPLFPHLATIRPSDRATEFKQRCQGLGIKGITLHSYRYAWAERAKVAGYPERFAMAALGHNSKAIHRAYSKRAALELPSLESYENQQLSKVESGVFKAA
jgi:integrase